MSIAQRDGRGVKPAHAVHATARRCRRRTEIEIWRARRVCANAWPENDLLKCERSPANIPPHKVLVHRLKRGRRRGIAGEDAIAKAGSVTFNLTLDPVRHVDGRVIGYVAIGPKDVLAVGCARRIEERRLRSKDKWAFRMAAVCNCMRGSGNLLIGSADVYRDGLAAFNSAPGHRLRKCEVHLERGGSRLKALQRAAITAT